MKPNLPPHPTRRHSLKPLVLAMLCVGLAPAVAQTLPTGFNAVMGGVSMAQPNAATMNIQQTTARAIAQWNSFSIGAGATVNVAQPAASSVLLNRVVGNELSTIAGRLNANGHVYLVNPNGVLFSKGSSVSVGGLVASTLDISNAGFMAGKQLVFERDAGNKASVVNAGSIVASDGGTVALMGADVRNEGSIDVARGTIGLLSGRRVSMDFEGDGLTTFRVDADSLAGSASVENAAGATLAADGGRVVIAADASSIGQRVVNQAGVVRARTLAGREGEIVLGGGAGNDVHVTGSLDATGAAAGEKGGRIDVASNRILLDGGTVDASGAAGGGNVLVHATDMGVITAGTTLRSSATVDGDGGRIVALGDNGLRAQGQFVARGAGDQGQGGFVETSGHALDVSGARVDTSAPSGRAGTWLLDPFDVNIVPGAAAIPEPVPPGPTVFEPVEATATISDGDINLALTTTNVTVNTGAGGLDDVGNITFADGVAIQYAGDKARTLRLEANQNIAMAAATAKASIVSTGAPLNVEFIADINKTVIVGEGGDFRLGGRVEYTGTITTNGGAVTMQGFSTGVLCAVCLASAAIDTRSATTPLGGAVNLLALQGDVSVAAASSIQTGTGNVGLTGDGARILANSSINTTSGAVNITGTGSGNIGVSITGSKIGTATGDIVISGTAVGEGGDGVFITGSTLATAGGKLGITGTGNFGDGVSIDTSTLTSGEGDLSVVGNADFGSGVSIGADATLGATEGNLSIVGTGNFGTGLFIGPNAKVSTIGGDLSIVGTGDAGNGGVVIDTSTITSGAGDLSITGFGAAGGEGGGGAGVEAQASTIGSTTGSLSITGTGGDDVGVDLFAGSKVSTTSGIMRITGTGEFDDGVTIADSSLQTDSGQINITGTGDFFSTGVLMFGSNILATGAGSVQIQGTGIDGTGVGIFGASGTVTIQTQGGDIGITGIATLPVQGEFVEANGLAMNGATVQSVDGNITLRGHRGGADSTGDGIFLQNGTQITTTGIGNIEATGEAEGSGAGVRLSSVPPIEVDFGGDLLFALAAFVPSPAPASFIFSNHNALVRATNDGSTDALAVDGSLAANGVLNLRPGGVDIDGVASDRAGDITLGGGAATGFAVSDAEFANLFGSALVVGSNAHVGNINAVGALTSDAAITLQNGGGGNIALNAPVSALQVGLLSAGNITQAGGAPITADSMLARSTGGFVLLNNPANNVGTLGGGAAGRFEFHNANALSVAPISVTGFDAASDQPVLASTTAGAGLNGTNVRVETATGNLNIASGVAASDNVVLRTLAAGDLNVDASVTGSKVVLEAAGNVIQAFGGGTVKPGGQLLAPGDTTPIVAANLLVQADGDVSMTNPFNRVGTIAGSATGRFDYADADALTIGSVTAVDRQQTFTGTGIQANTVRVRTYSDDLTLAAGVTSTEADLIAGARFQNPVGAGAPATGDWRVWANTWVGENRGGLAGSGPFPNFYNCSYGGPCGVTVTTGSDHFIYTQQPVLTFTIGSAARRQASLNPPFGFTMTGLILGDTGIGVVGSVGTAANLQSPAGLYPINGSFSSAEGYAVNVVPGVLTVNALPNFTMKPDVLREEPTTWLYDRNIGQAPICFATGSLDGDRASQGGDVLAREWSRVRSRPNLISCVSTEKRNGCADF